MKRSATMAALLGAAAVLLVLVLALGRPPVAEPTVTPPEPGPRVPAQTELRMQTLQEPADVPEWDRPRFEERSAERRRMVRDQMERRGIADAAVLDAMRNVPRHLFVPEDERRLAYSDFPLPIGHGQTISQPYVVAYMTEALKLKPGQKVLEIGTGSGYQAAVLAEVTPHVFTIEIVEELATPARRRLADLGYKTVQAKQGDGYYGWPEKGPFDAVIVTAAAGHVPPPLMEQLKPGGRMIIPLGGVYDVQQLVLVTRDEEGAARTRSLLPVRFVPMTGTAQEAAPERSDG